jgi:hypothetical protein
MPTSFKAEHFISALAAAAVMSPNKEDSELFKKIITVTEPNIPEEITDEAIVIAMKIVELFASAADSVASLPEALVAPTLDKSEAMKKLKELIAHDKDLFFPVKLTLQLILGGSKTDTKHLTERLH